MRARFRFSAIRPSSTGPIGIAPRILMSLLAAAFFLSGVGVFIFYGMIRSTWLPVEATIIRSEVIPFRNQKQRYLYRGEVELKYTVQGRDFQTPDTFHYSSTSEDSLRRDMETTYATGTRHRIFFNPADPYAIRWDLDNPLLFYLLPGAFTGVGLILIGVCYLLWRLPFPIRPRCARCGDFQPIDTQYCGRCGDPLSTNSRPSSSPEASAKRTMRRLNDNPRALFLVGAFFGLPGLLCVIGASYLGMMTYTATEIWPAVEASVTRSVIEASRNRDGMPNYQLAVDFQYGAGENLQHVAGKTIYSSNSFPWMKRQIARFEVGSQHLIRVNPDDASDIRFDLESPLLNAVPTAALGLFGVIFFSIGGSLVIWSFKPRCISCRHEVHRNAAFCSMCGQSREASLTGQK